MNMTFNSNSDDGFSSYHIAGFIMIIFVVCIFSVLYYLSIRGNKSFEPHQYKSIIDKNNKYNKR